MKKLLLIILNLFFIQISNAQCPDPISIVSIDVQNALCLGSGIITINGMNPVADSPDFYQYSLYNESNTVLVRDWQSSNVFSSVNSGTYTVRVRRLCNTSPFISNVITQSVTIQDQTIPINIGIINVLQEDVCGDGIIQAVASGKAPLSYALVTSLTAIDDPFTYVATRQLSSVFDSLSGGTYYVRVYDSCNNYITQSIFLGTFDNYKSALVEPVSKKGCDSLFFNFLAEGVREDISMGTDSQLSKSWVQWPNGDIDTQFYNSNNSFYFTYNDLDPSYTSSTVPFPNNISGWPYTIKFGFKDACGDIFTDSFILTKPMSVGYIPVTVTEMNKCDSLATKFIFQYNNVVNNFDMDNSFMNIFSETYYSIDTGATWHSLSLDSIYVNNQSRIIYTHRAINTKILFAYCGDTLDYVVNAVEVPPLNTMVIQGPSTMESCNDATIFTYLLGSNHFSDSLIIEMISAPVGQDILDPIRLIASGNAIVYSNIKYGTYTIRIYDSIGLGDCGRFRDLIIDLTPPLLQPTIVVDNSIACKDNSGIYITNILARDTVSIKIVSAPTGQPLGTFWHKTGTPIPPYFKNMKIGNYVIEIADSVGEASNCPRISSINYNLSYPVDIRMTVEKLCTGNIVVSENTSRRFANSNLAWQHFIKLKVYDSLGNTVYGGSAGMPYSSFSGTTTMWNIPASVISGWAEGTYTFKVFNNHTAIEDCSMVEENMYVSGVLSLSSSVSISSCDGITDSVTIVSAAKGGVPPYSYTLYKTSYDIANLIAGPQYSPIFNGLNNSDVYYISASDQCGTSLVMEVTGNIVDFNAAILNYSEMPCVGDSLTIKVANLPSTSYQWYKNGTLIPGANTSQYHISSLNNADSGTYTVEINAGTCSKVSPSILIDPDLCGTPLSIQNITANAKNQNNNALITWTVVNEKESQEYTVERSLDGRTFTTINNQTGSDGAYSYLDKEAQNGLNYYRIKVSKENNNIYYTSVMPVMIGSENEGIQVFPIPTHSNLQISLPQEGISHVRLMTIDGKTIIQSEYKNNSYSIDVSNIENGIYFLQVSQQGKIYNKKIVVKR